MVARSTLVVHGPLAIRMQRLAVARQGNIGREILPLVVARLAGGFIAPVNRKIRPPNPRSETTACAVTRGNITKLAVSISFPPVQTIGYNGKRCTSFSQLPLKDKASLTSLSQNPRFVPRPSRIE
jgi:hypothetical protein